MSSEDSNSDQLNQEKATQSSDHENPEVGFYARLKSSGIEGYVCLGSLVVEAIERNELQEFVEHINSLSNERKEQVLSFSHSQMLQGIEKTVEEARVHEESLLWSRAMDNGLRATLSDYRNSTNSDIYALFDRIETVRKQTKFSSGFIASVITGFVTTVVLAFFLFAAQNILANPFEFLIPYLSKSDQ